MELYTDNDARTLKVEPLTEDKYQIAVRQSKRYDSADPATLVTAAVERAKTRAAEKSKVDYSKVGRLADKAYELRTVDIKDLWQVQLLARWGIGVSLRRLHEFVQTFPTPQGNVCTHPTSYTLL